MHERVQLCQDPQTEFALLLESLGVSRVNHILRVHGHKILEEQRAAAVYDEMGQRSLERLFPGLTEDSTTQATPSAGQSGSGFKRARDIAAPAHLGALIAAKPRIQGMIRDAVQADPRNASLSEVIETATSTCLSALDNDEEATAKLYVQKAAQAANYLQEEEDSDDMDFSAPRKSRPSAPQLQAQLSRLTDRARLGRLKDTTCATLRSPISGYTAWTRAREVSSRRTTTSPMFRKDLATESGWEVASADDVALSWTHSWNMQKTATPPKPRGGISRVFMLETGRPWHYHGTQEAHSFAIQAG